MNPLLKVNVTKEANGVQLNIGFTKIGNEHLYSDTFKRSKILKKEDLKNLDKVLEKSTYIGEANLSHESDKDFDRFYYFKGKIREKEIRLNVARQVKKSKNGFLKKTLFVYSINDIK